MKKAFLTSVLSIIALVLVHGGLKPGDKAVPFSLKNVDGKTVSLSDYNSQKGVIVIFTCNPCPFAKAYEQRIIELHDKFAGMGFPVLALNSNNPAISPEDSFENMKARAKEKAYPFPYLVDDQNVFKAYGATRTPHVYFLEKSGNSFKVAYIGAIDDNAMEADAVSKKYLEGAIKSVIAGNKPSPASTKAIGCTIKAQGS
jgi:peroxiredoxin